MEGLLFRIELKWKQSSALLNESVYDGDDVRIEEHFLEIVR